MSTVRSLIDRSVLRQSVLVTLVLSIPPLVIVRIVKGDDMSGRESNLWLLAALCVLVAYLIGGAVASVRSREFQLTNAAAAAVYAFVIMALASAVIALLFGGHLNESFVLVVTMMGALCVSAATLGGYALVRWKEWRG
jgi:predicted permease